MSASFIINLLNNMAKANRIRKKDAKRVRDLIKHIEDEVEDDDLIKVEEMVELLEEENLGADEKIKLNNIKGPFIKIIKKYKDYFDDDVADEDMSPEDIEKLLDEKVVKYNKLSKCNPMQYLTWHRTKKRYRTCYKNIDLLFRTLGSACDKIMECKNATIISDNNNDTNVIVSDGVQKNYFSYNEHRFFCYWVDNNPYFDIEHILSLLDLKRTSHDNKYSEYSDQVKYYLWNKNIYDGYILRKLIDETTVHRLIYSSNSAVSKIFKNNPFKIPDYLREECSKILREDVIPYIFGITNHLSYARELAHSGSRRSISKFADHHVLYAVLLLEKHLPEQILLGEIPPTGLDNKKITIKFGYTEDMIERLRSLQSEYKCTVIFINAKIIRGRKDETLFHKILKTKYSNLIRSHRIKDAKKTELYYLNPMLMQEFDDYLKKEENKDYRLASQKLDIEASKLKYDNFDKETTLLKLQIKLNKYKLRLMD